MKKFVAMFVAMVIMLVGNAAFAAELNYRERIAYGDEYFENWFDVYEYVEWTDTFGRTILVIRKPDRDVDYLMRVDVDIYSDALHKDMLGRVEFLIDTEYNNVSGFYYDSRPGHALDCEFDILIVEEGDNIADWMATFIEDYFGSIAPAE